MKSDAKLELRTTYKTILFNGDETNNRYPKLQNNNVVFLLSQRQTSIIACGRTNELRFEIFNKLQCPVPAINDIIFTFVANIISRDNFFCLVGMSFI